MSIPNILAARRARQAAILHHDSKSCPTCCGGQLNRVEVSDDDLTAIARAVGVLNNNNNNRAKGDCDDKAA